MKIRGKVQQYVKIGGKITVVWAVIGGEWRQTGACARAQRGTTQQAPVACSRAGGAHRQSGWLIRLGLAVQRPSPGGFRADYL